MSMRLESSKISRILHFPLEMNAYLLNKDLDFYLNLIGIFF
jgi:hypothetical protein